MEQEGILKYQAEKISSAIYNGLEVNELMESRQICFDNHWIGIDSYGTGYGNISTRINSNSFLITNSQTGGISNLNSSHFSLVDSYSIDSLHLTYHGLNPPSSESISHAAMYQASNKIKAVVHIHNKKIWAALINILPTVPKEFDYGTKEMALIIRWITAKAMENAQRQHISILMAGHEDGLIVGAKSLDDAIKAIEQLLLQANQNQIQ